MEKMRCDQCGNNLPDSSDQCPSCEIPTHWEVSDSFGKTIYFPTKTVLVVFLSELMMLLSIKFIVRMQDWAIGGMAFLMIGLLSFWGRRHLRTLHRLRRLPMGFHWFDIGVRWYQALLIVAILWVTIYLTHRPPVRKMRVWKTTPSLRPCSNPSGSFRTPMPA